MRRRSFLIGAAGTGLVAATGLSAFALTRTPAAALRPWSEAEALPPAGADPRPFVLRHAVLAPNPHNRQPWIVELSGPDGLTLWCDLDRRLPETDPFDRQIVIGLGAFTELAAVAASRLGFRLDVTPFPEGEPAPRLDRRPVAHLRLVSIAGLRPDPLSAHVLARRSTKRPFDLDRPVPAAAAARFAELSGGGAAVATVLDADRVARLRDLTWAAWTVEAETPRTNLESVRLMRIGRAEIEAAPDGISLGGPFLEALSAVGRLSREQLADPTSSASAQGRAMYRAMLAATPAYLTVVSPDGSRAGQLAAGRAYLRANLAATAAGLALHPVSQALQEFPEMARLKAELEGVLAVAPPARLHMLARLGYGPAVPPTPRWAAATRLRTG